MFNDTEEKIRFLKIAKRIYLCISRNRAESIINLRLDTSLNNKLGLDGDDVDELFYDINKHVNIDWTTFNFYDYFNDEGITILAFIRIIFAFPLFIFLRIFQIILKIFNLDLDIRRYSIFVFGKNKRDFKIEQLLLAGYRGKWVDSESISIPIEEELRNWQNKFHFRFQRKFYSKT